MNRRSPFFGSGDPFAPGDPFANFSGFGGHQDIASSFFGGMDPFSDPFFTQPIGGMFESNFFGTRGNPFVGLPQPGFLLQPGFPGFPGFPQNQQPPAPRSGGPVIEELNSDEENDKKEGTNEGKDNPRKHGRSRKDPLAGYPDDVVEEPEGRRSKQLQMWNGNRATNFEHPQRTSHGFSFQSSTVTYGGGDGAYYTSSTTRRAGSDGITFEESKEANSATRQAAHRVSRGIHDKGHSVTRKLNSDGKVDTMQTLHNIEEDEVVGFEEKWRGKAAKHLPGWNEGLNMPELGRSGQVISNAPTQGVRALPCVERSYQPQNSAKPEMEHAGGPSRPRPVERANVGVGGKSGGSARSRNQVWKH